MESSKGGNQDLPAALGPRSRPIRTEPLTTYTDERAHRLGEESLHTVLANYINYYAAGDGHTARAKRYDLQHFLQFLAGGRPLEEVLVSEWTLQSTKDFIDHRLALGEAPTTAARRLATIKHLGRTLAERVSGYINPAREVKSPIIPQTNPSGLNSDEIQLLREAAQLNLEKAEGDFAALRNQFLLELLLSTGLRADEVRLLVMAQISEDRSWLKNVKTKGRKYRKVYLDSQIRDHIDFYLTEREKTILGRYPLLSQISAAERARFPVLVSFYRAQLVNPASFGLSPKSIWRIIAELGQKAQAIAPTPMGNLHPHRLRHTFAHGLLDSSKDVRLVAQALGHSDVRITMRYTERSEEEIARAIEAKVAR